MNTAFKKQCETCSRYIPREPAWKKLCYTCYVYRKSGQEERDELAAAARAEARAEAVMEHYISLGENAFERDSDYRRYVVGHVYDTYRPEGIYSDHETEELAN